MAACSRRPRVELIELEQANSCSGKTAFKAPKKKSLEDTHVIAINHKNNEPPETTTTQPQPASGE